MSSPPLEGPSATLPQLTLRYPCGDQVRWTAVRTDGIRIGRRDDCGIVLPGAEVSREHAEVRLEGGHWVLRDLGSANGTWIGDERVATRALRDGDRIRIDGHEIQCWIDEPGLIPAPEPGQAAAGGLYVGDFDALVAQVLAEERSGGPQPGPGAASRATTELAGTADSIAAGVDEATTDDRLLEPVTRVMPASRAGAGATSRPATARAAAPARVDDPLGLLQIVHRATETLLEHDTLDGTLERVVDLVFEHLPAERCVVLLVDAATGHLVPHIERTLQGGPPSGLRISRHIAEAALRSQQAVLVRDTSADERFARAESVLLLRICAAMCAPMAHRGRVAGLVYVDRTSGGAPFGAAELGMLSILATVSAAAVERARVRASLERERRVRERLGRYHAPGVVERIVHAAERGGSVMQSEEREVSVLFADIAGFTRFAESRPPREVTAVLNRILGLLTAAVFDAGGTLDKFIGDAVMAFFGAPLAQPDHARRAVRAALAMQARLAADNAGRPPQERFDLHIGVNTGPVIVGDIGAEQRLDYTVIGDAVNVASRLESTVAATGQVVIGEATHAAVGDAFDCVPLPPVVLKGRRAPFQPYLVRGERAPDDATPTLPAAG